MKEILGKATLYNKSKLPRKLIIDKRIITEETEIASEFNKFFTEIGPSLANKIPNSNKSFETFLEKANTTMQTASLTINELKDAFFSLKINKSPGADEITFNVIKECFGDLSDILKYIFDLSLQSGTFPDSLKVAKVTSLFKSGYRIPCKISAI